METIDWGKRIKSFLMTAVSLFVGAFVVVIVTPEGAAVLEYGRELLSAAGIPAVVVTFLGLLVAEIWKQVVNSYNIAKAARNEGTSKTSVMARAQVNEVSLY
jgi:hypothetical protein